MAEKEAYVIRVQGRVMEVTPEVYYTCFHMERQEREQEEKMRRNSVLSHDTLDNGTLTGLESMMDQISVRLYSAFCFAVWSRERCL